MDTNQENFQIFNNTNWVGLTKDQVTDKMTELFGNTVNYSFTHRFTEVFILNHAEFDMENDVVVRSYWG